jgi:hypothetical protein
LTRRRTRLRARNYALGAQLDTFLVCAATGVVVNRVFLIITGYPQVGGRNPDAIHISHAIYGPFAMMIATALAISFLAPTMRWVLAVVGGLGFGWFVDELGKFVSNAGYLFKPALALIYVTFIVMFLAFRALTNRAFGPDDAIANALESLKSASLGTLDDESRQRALSRFDAAAPTGSFATRVRELLDDAPASPAGPPGPIRRLRARIRPGGHVQPAAVRRRPRPRGGPPHLRDAALRHRGGATASRRERSLERPRACRAVASDPHIRERASASRVSRRAASDPNFTRAHNVTR